MIKIGLKEIILVTVLLLALILVRVFESIFYDPFILFFKSDYISQALPEYSTLKLYVFVGLRYLINSLLSLGLIWVLYRQKEFIKISIYFYFTAFVILMLLLHLLLHYSLTDSYLPLFYVRRFLIQPLFLLLLVPAFHYYLKTEQK